MIFVTGGTGLVGSHLLFKLIQQHSNIKALYRADNKLQAVKHVFSYYTDEVDELFSKIEWVKGDITDIIGLQEHLKDVTHVYHCAALISFDPNDYAKLRKINIEGTANVVNASISSSVKKLCYVSSIAATGEEPDNKIITETSPWNSEADHSVYAITKYGAEMEVWRGTQEGLDAVIVNPGIIIGGGFWRTGSGRLLRNIYKGQSHYTNGVSAYVDVDDVVRIMINLMTSTIKNQGFIVISENLSFKAYADCVAKNLNVKPPSKEAKNWQLQLGWRLDWLRAIFTKKRRRLTKQLAKSISNDTYYSNQKVIGALDHEFTLIEESIQAAILLFLKDL